MCLKRFLTLLLVLFSFCFYSAASEIQNNLTSIEDTLIQLETNSLEQKSIIENLQKDLEASQLTCINLENLRIEMSAELDNALKSLKKQELLSRNWRIAAGVSISASIISIGTLIMVWSNK